VEGQQALAKTGKIPVRRGIKTSSSELDRVLEDGRLHVLKEEGEYGQYMRLYNQALQF
jgi:hypothetical protein